MIDFSKQQIDEWLALAETGNNSPEKPGYVSEVEQEPSLKVRMLEAKVLIDRHALITTAFIFHSSHKELVREKLGTDLNKFASNNDYDRIWGANIYYSNNIPTDKGLALAMEFIQERDGRAVAILSM